MPKDKSMSLRGYIFGIVLLVIIIYMVFDLREEIVEYAIKGVVVIFILKLILEAAFRSNK